MAAFNKHLIRNIFFDLDHTIWDFEANSIETLNELFEFYNLQHHVASKELFISTYQLINKQLWDLYHKNLIDRDSLRLNRFIMTLDKFNVADFQLASDLADDYLKISPGKGKLFPQAHEVLIELKKNFRLHLITNGFKEVQITKIKTSGLEKYFDNIFISEEIGFVKPQAEIFNHALKVANAISTESIMVGDNYEADVLGASSVGMSTVFFNPQRIANNYKATFEISELNDLLLLLQ